MKSAPSYVLVLDVGTTALKVIAFDQRNHPLIRVSASLEKSHPKRGWVEQDPKQFVTVSRALLARAVREAKLDPAFCAGVGITNQRETVIAWDRETGKPIYPAIVWEDSRTARSCAEMRTHRETFVRRRTGLSLEAYFSASKMAWILANVPFARTLAEQDQLAFGTVDTWLLWHLCGHHPFVTDVTNASRTLLYNVKTMAWDSELCELFGISEKLLAEVRPSLSAFGHLSSDIMGARPQVVAVCGDQEASMYAAMSASGGARMCTKVTYGTGTFVMQSLGKTFALVDGFYTTPVPHGEGISFAVEAKIDRGGKEVEPLLRHPLKLRQFLRRLARDVQAIIVKLPKKPHTLIVDGGVSRDGLVGTFQAEQSKAHIISLPMFDGTALGCAMMCWRSLTETRILK
ncbi:MAG: FGGY family carbohydrate kinase [Patescibacteria group bacterium]